MVSMIASGFIELNTFLWLEDQCMYGTCQQLAALTLAPPGSCQVEEPASESPPPNTVAPAEIRAAPIVAAAAPAIQPLRQKVQANVYGKQESSRLATVWLTNQTY
jgi:hypothetical protein